MHETEVNMQKQINEAKDDLRVTLKEKNLELKTLKT